MSLVGPTLVKARTSFLYTEGFLKVENKEHLVDFVITLYFTSFCFNALCSGKVSVNFQKFENEKNISQIAGMS